MTAMPAPASTARTAVSARSTRASRYGVTSTPWRIRLARHGVAGLSQVGRPHGAADRPHVVLARGRVRAAACARRARRRPRCRDGTGRGRRRRWCRWPPGRTRCRRRRRRRSRPGPPTCRSSSGRGRWRGSRPRQLVGVRSQVPHAERAGERRGRVQFAASQARRDGGDGQHPVRHRAPRDRRRQDQRRVGAAGVGDGERAVARGRCPAVSSPVRSRRAPVDRRRARSATARSGKPSLLGGGREIVVLRLGAVRAVLDADRHAVDRRRSEARGAGAGRLDAADAERAGLGEEQLAAAGRRPAAGPARAEREPGGPSS